MPASIDEQWIACPKCHIANVASRVYCDSCGAVLDPNAAPPKYRSGASPGQWALIIGLCTFLIGSAVWVGLSPNGAAGKVYFTAIPFVYGFALLLGFVRAAQRFRMGDITSGITTIAMTILFGLATLPAIIDFKP